MIVVYCDSCTHELVKQGGLLFGAPDIDGNVEKYHLCVQCVKRVLEYVDPDRGK